MKIAKTLFVSVFLLAFSFVPVRVQAQTKAPGAFTPDPLTVRRSGSGYRYPESGWIVLHVEGEPYARGHQHGALLATEITDYMRALAHSWSSTSVSEGWRTARLLTNAIFLRRYDPELLLEMRGIADGAGSMGATFEGRPIDLLDVATINSAIELGCLGGALDALPDGIDKAALPAMKKAAEAQDHCSAFAATGPATKDGKIVFGHITMWGLSEALSFNVWLDLQPTKGHRIVMQTYPGGIQSGMDWYMNDAGMLVSETTIAQTKFEIDAEPLASRIRRALQYGTSIDEIVKILSEKNNGLYSNEWMIGDTKTDEIAMFELGTKKSKLWRSSKNEWFGPTPGFYWGCNNAKDMDVRLECECSLTGEPKSLVWRPMDRDITWCRLYEKWKGKIDLNFGFEAYATAPLVGSSSLDAKFTTSAMAKDMSCFAFFGPPRGRVWYPNDAQKAADPEIRPLVPNEWCVLGKGGVTAANSVSRDSSVWVDDEAREPLATRFPGLDDDFNDADGAEAAKEWTGSILPKTDADLWLAIAMPAYRHFFTENGKTFDNDPFHEGPDPMVGFGFSGFFNSRRIRLAAYLPLARYRTALARGAAECALADIQPTPGNGDWYDIALGRGFLFLDALRSKIGEEAFLRTMKALCGAFAGKPCGTDDLRAIAEKESGASLAAFFDERMHYRATPKEVPVTGWSVFSFEEEPEQALIVYGTLHDAFAQKDAARLLQIAIADRWYNYEVPIKADIECTPEDVAGHHIVCVGTPETNAVLAQMASALPVTFGAHSFEVVERRYENETTWRFAHEKSAVVAAGPNPRNARYSVVAYAGNAAEATWRVVQRVTERGRRIEPWPNVIVFPANGEARRYAIFR